MGHVMKKMMPSGKVRIEHADGFHDDLTMASAIALAIHYEEPVYEFPDFRRLLVRYAPESSVYQ
jgi:hypothetical protein